MRSPQYESVEEAQTRLNNTVFLYKDLPVLCQAVSADSNGPQLHLIFLPGLRDEAVVPISDPDLSYKFFNIGYVNTSRGAVYVERIPCVGRYKQGLAQDNMQIHMAHCDKESYDSPTWNTLFKTVGFRDMLLRQYPSYKESLSRVQSRKAVSVAFDDSLALGLDDFRKDILLFYRGRKIGFMSRDGVFTVPREFRYLTEFLTSRGIRTQ